MRLAHYWEYKYVAYSVMSSPTFIVEQLNDLGRDGWQLVSIDSGRGGMFLKRGVVNLVREPSSSEAGE